MKIKGWLLVVFSFLLAGVSGFGQTPPPNDNFSNRIVLTGTDLTFSGTLAGATLEDYWEANSFDVITGSPATQSIWWSWTAPMSTALTLQILSSTQGEGSLTGTAGIAIYDVTNGGTNLDDLSLPPSGITTIVLAKEPQTLSIPVTAGTEYDIQIVGSTSANYSVKLIATNTPVIIQQPRNRTVYSNACALFYVLAAGVNQPAFTFQWLFNGTNLPGETAPMLAISNIDASMAGPYSVIVSNSAGFSVSDPAMLSVSQSNVPISLAVTGTFSNSAVQSNFAGLSVTGENGRSYRLESSTDLTNWAPDLEMVMEPHQPFPHGLTSVFYDTNSPQNLAVVNNTARKFFRVTPYAPYPATVDLCVNHLEQIRIAKLLWQRDYDVSGVATPRTVDLLPYFPRQSAPICPLDFYHSFETSYNLNNLMTDPACIIYPTTHFLEEPR